MKKISVVVSAMAICLASYSQLKNTKWVATVKGDNPRRIYFNFSEGGLTLYNVSDSSMVEAMVCEVAGDQFTLHKIDGQSDCDNTTPGKYSYRIARDSLYMKLVQDACDDRSSAINGIGAVRWKKHTEIKINPATLPQYAGTYSFTADREVIITAENGQLQIEGPKIGLPKLPLQAIGPDKFFLKIAYVEMEFKKDASGKVVALISHEEKDAVLKKIK